MTPSVFFISPATQQKLLAPGPLLLPSSGPATPTLKLFAGPKTRRKASAGAKLSAAPSEADTEFWLWPPRGRACLGRAMGSHSPPTALFTIPQTPSLACQLRPAHSLGRYWGGESFRSDESHRNQLRAPIKGTKRRHESDC